MSSPVTADHDLLIAWVREAADELEKAHALLDALAIPLADSAGVPYTLAARIGLLEDERDTTTIARAYQVSLAEAVINGDI